MATLNLATNERAQRKLLITAASWKEGTTEKKQILGARTEDSSIEFNAEINTVTDILGITYTDVEKTEPQQTFDPMYILGGTDLHAYLTQAALKNDINAYNGKFDLYIITMFINGSGTSGSYYAVRHNNCSIIPTSIGGDAYVNLPVEVHFSNDIDEGTATVTKDTNGKTVFTFTKS